MPWQTLTARRKRREANAAFQSEMAKLARKGLGASGIPVKVPTPGKAGKARPGATSNRPGGTRAGVRKRKKSMSRKEQAKRLKKSGLVLWSLVVRKRDGKRCLMCGKTENLNAHHWLFRRSHSVRLALDPANGSTLCAYPCHLGRIHHDGDGDFMLRLADKMQEIVGKEKIEEMRATARNVTPVSLEEIQEAHDKLTTALGG